RRVAPEATARHRVAGLPELGARGLRGSGGCRLDRTGRARGASGRPATAAERTEGLGAAVRARAPDRAARCGGAVESWDRGAVVPLAPHGRLPPLPDLPEARRAHPCPAPSGPRR